MEYMYLDTEFNRKEVNKRGLVSLAMVGSDGSQYYAVNNDMDLSLIANDPEIGPWMTANVFDPHIPHHSMRRLDQSAPEVKPYNIIGCEVDEFLHDFAERSGDFEVIVNCGAQDVIRLRQAVCNEDWGIMGSYIPQYADDIARIKRRAYALGMEKGSLPEQDPRTVHHALHDATHEARVHRYILEQYGAL